MMTTGMKELYKLEKIKTGLNWMLTNNKNILNHILVAIITCSYTITNAKFDITMYQIIRCIYTLFMCVLISSYIAIAS